MLAVHIKIACLAIEYVAITGVRCFYGDAFRPVTFLFEEPNLAVKTAVGVMLPHRSNRLHCVRGYQKSRQAFDLTFSNH